MKINLRIWLVLIVVFLVALVIGRDRALAGGHHQTISGDDNFATAPVLSISGKVRNYQNQPIQGVSLTNGAGQKVLTDSDGDYKFNDLLPGTYSITPSYGQYAFVPQFRLVSLPPSANKQDFVQAQPSVYLPIILRKPCQSFYFDDFSDPGSGWPDSEDEDTQYEYINGEYKILVKNMNSWAGASPDFQASEYSVGVDVRSTSGVMGTHGIIFGLADDWSSFHTFEIDPQGYYTIWEYSDNGGWKNLIVAFSPHINQSTEVNQLEVKHLGDSIEFYANGNSLPPPKSKINIGMGYLGLIVSSYDESNVEARFDNFYIDALACASSSSLIPAQGKESLIDNATLPERVKELR